MATNTDAIMALAAAHLTLVSKLVDKGVISNREYNDALSAFGRRLKNASPEALELLSLLQVEDAEKNGEQS